MAFAGLVGGESALTLERWLRIEEIESERDPTDAAELTGVLRVTSPRVRLLIPSSGAPSMSSSGSGSVSGISLSENSVRGTTNFSTSAQVAK